MFSLFSEIESRFLLQGLEELWNMIHEESSSRRKCIRAMDESLKEIERSRAMKVSCSLNNCYLSIRLVFADIMLGAEQRVA